MKTTAIHEPGWSRADLQVFHEIARSLMSSPDLEATLRMILGQMEHVFAPETLALLLDDSKERDLHYAIVKGRSRTSLSGRRVAYGTGMAGQAATSGEPLIIPQAAAGCSSHAGPGEGIDFEVQNAVSIPLRSGKRTLGVVQLFNLPQQMLSAYSISMLLVLCDFAAIAIGNANSFRRVQKLTIVDECTGLFNLRHFEQTLKAELARSERQGVPMSLIFFDLDHFKRVNDQYGHQAGNRLLGLVGESTRSHIRGMDLAFRYGGDEFAILLPGTAKRQAVQVATRLLHAFRELSEEIQASYAPGVTASFGLASYPEDGKTGAELLDAADARMYKVKGTAGNAIVSSETAA